MDKLRAMTTFVRIVETGSLTAAAERLGTSPTSVVRSLSALERALGVRLLNRTTRRMALTDEGRDYFERCRRLLSEVEDAEAALLARQVTPAGRLVITAPVMFGRLHVAPLVIDFLDAFPDVRVELLLVDRIVDLIQTRERRGKHYGTIVLAEGLAEMLPDEVTATSTRDDHGHIPLGAIDLGKLVADRVTRRYTERTGGKKKIASVQLGYESRCAPPHAFDVMLGSQLGIGAYRALVEEGKDGHMVSVSGQLDLHYVPFHELVNPGSLRTEVRLIEVGSDFHRLARFLETRVDRLGEWAPGRRTER